MAVAGKYLNSGLGKRSVWIVAILAVGCSTVRQEPIGALPQLPPDYIQVPHPEGLDRADLVAIFTDLRAPAPDTLKGCDADFATLRTKTQNPKERAQGARELVRRDPVGYHWCFYSQLMKLDERLKDMSYIDEKQKEVLQTYVFLTPIGRAFMQEFSDTRYMRWAVNRYKQLSQYVFYRSVELSPRATEELASATNPFGAYRPSKDEPTSVLARYGLDRPRKEKGLPEGELPPSQATVAPAKASTDGTEEYAPRDESVDPAAPAPVAKDIVGDPLLEAYDPIGQQESAVKAAAPTTVPTETVRTPASDAPVPMEAPPALMIAPPVAEPAVTTPSGSAPRRRR